MFCLLNLLTDLLYALVDPRVRTQYQKSTGKKKPKRADKGAEL
jgi:hypothetical protein